MADGILFLCVANSARSQMAEGLARRLLPGTPIFSAGSVPTRPNPFALAALAEIGIDHSAARSKTIDEIPKDEIGTVITLCADEVCPAYYGHAERLHWPFPDPANVEGDDATRREAFVRVREMIRARLEQHFAR